MPFWQASLEGFTPMSKATSFHRGFSLHFCKGGFISPHTNTDYFLILILFIKIYQHLIGMKINISIYHFYDINLFAHYICQRIPSLFQGETNMKTGQLKYFITFTTFANICVSYSYNDRDWRYQRRYSGKNRLITGYWI